MGVWRRPVYDWTTLTNDVEALFLILRTVDSEVNPIPLVGVRKTVWTISDARTGTCRFVEGVYHLANGEVLTFRLAFHIPICHLFLTGNAATRRYKVVTLPHFRYDSVSEEVYDTLTRIRKCGNYLGANSSDDIIHIELRNPATPRVLVSKQLTGK